MVLAADILRGFTDTIILSRLADGPGYGYQINKSISESSLHAFELKEATLYTAFRRLEEAGLISSWWGGEATGARRRYYELTPEGVRRLRADLENWQETKDLMDRLLAARPEAPAYEPEKGGISHE